MDGYKHIESAVGKYIAARYRNAVEVGIGQNTTAAAILQEAGVLKCCTDIRDFGLAGQLPFSRDDIFDPDIHLYNGADAIYSIRPAIEMIPPLIAIAFRIDCDLVVYHLGFETYGDGGVKIDCGVRLHLYHSGSRGEEKPAR
jgi:uncharacterized UPF0146 family protein